MALKDDYKDDILDVSVNTKRKYRMTENQDGTVSFDDETVYTQEGDSFGASDINAITEAVNNNSGMPVGTIATFDGTTLPSGFEPYQTEEQRAIAQINDNLAGFKFYPTGTELVAYIEGHGWYKDADGNYVIWGTATANALVEASPNTYYGRQSEEDLRGEVGADTGIPFKGKPKVIPYSIHTLDGVTIDLGFVPKYLYFWHGNRGNFGIYINDGTYNLKRCVSYENNRISFADNALTVNGTSITILPSDGSPSQYRYGDGFVVAFG